MIDDDSFIFKKRVADSTIAISKLGFLKGTVDIQVITVVFIDCSFSVLIVSFWVESQNLKEILL